MAKWIAVYREEDMPWGEEVRISVEGTEFGFVGMADNGEELLLMPVDTVEEAREDVAYLFAGYDTFRWLDGED